MKALLSAVLLISLFLSPSLNRQTVDARMELASPVDVWVDAQTGSDLNNGTSRDQALRTIQAAANLAGAGTTVHILPGVFRESVVPVSNGTSFQPIVFKAEAGPGTVKIRGSESASALTWQRLSSNTIGLPNTVDPAKIYSTDISSWNLDEAPRFLVTVNNAGEISERLMPAREPDWRVETEWKMHEFWWIAEGGSAPAQCDPTHNNNEHCDLPQRSYTQITDAVDDSEPAGIEPGNLTTLGNLTGATIIAMDSPHGLYVYRRTITSHDVSTGRVTVDANCESDGAPGLGWGSKYYIENHPALLDQPGEWWYDAQSGRVYLWPLDGMDPSNSNLEISRLDAGFDLTGRSYIILDGLTVELYNGQAYTINNKDPRSKAFGNEIRNAVIRYANSGIVLYQYMNENSLPESAIDGFLLENSEIANMDTEGISSFYWWPNAPSPAAFPHAGIRNSIYRGNQIHHIGYNSDSRNPVGVRIYFPDQLRFESNHIHHIANAGMHLHLSLIDSENEYAFDAQEILIGDILIANNLFEQTCLLSFDCGGLKIGGSSRPDTHVFKNVLVTGNVFRHIFAWSHVIEMRYGSGYGGGNGFYLDYASGVHVYRNISYNNSGAGYKLSCLWRDGDAIFYNNIAANNYVYGMKLTGTDECDNHDGSVNTQIVNNIFINNGQHGMQLISEYRNTYGNLIIDHNLYYKNGWAGGGLQPTSNIQLYNGSAPFTYFSSLVEIRVRTPWESGGNRGNPRLANYDPSDHAVYMHNWPDFHPTQKSYRVIDKGSATLPPSLISLLQEYNVEDIHCGDAFEIGAFELVMPSSVCNDVREDQPSANEVSPYPITPFARFITPGIHGDSQ